MRRHPSFLHSSHLEKKIDFGELLRKESRVLETLVHLLVSVLQLYTLASCGKGSSSDFFIGIQEDLCIHNRLRHHLKKEHKLIVEYWQHNIPGSFISVWG
jgi:hypothetical protein